jgi:hypothetical protein
MPQLIIALLVIILVIGLAALAFGVLIAAIPSWIAGMIFGGGILLIVCQTKITELTTKENLGSVIDLSISNSNIHWNLRDTANVSIKNLILFCSLLGAACAGVIGYFLFLNASESDKGFFAIAIVVSSLAVPFCFAKLRPHKMFEKGLRNRVTQIMAAFDQTVGNMDELQKLETSIHSLAGQLQLAFPVNYTAEVEQYVRSHQSELVFERATFSEFVNARIELARKDKEELDLASQQMELANIEYKETLPIVTKSRWSPYVERLDGINKYLHTTNLTDFLANRSWDDFKIAIADGIEEMKLLGEDAKRHQTTGGGEKSQTSMSREEALKMLGLSENYSREEVAESHRKLVRRFHTDHASDLTAPLIEEVEEISIRLGQAKVILLETIK